MLSRDDLVLNDRAPGAALHVTAQEADDPNHRVAVVSMPGTPSVALAVGTDGPSSVVSLTPDLARTIGTALLAAARHSERP